MLGTQLQGIHEPPHDKTNKMAIAPGEYTDQPVHPPSLIRVFAVHMKKHWVLSYPLSALRRLIRLGGCPGWFESSLGTKAFFVGFVMRWLTFRKCIIIFASGLRNKPHFRRPCSLALWLQSQGSLVRAPALQHTGYTCNVRRISHAIMHMVLLLFPLIQERQFLVISGSICTLDHFVLVNCLEGPSLSTKRSGYLIASPGFIDRKSANQIYWYMRGVVVTLSRSLHKFRWCWDVATSSSHTNLPTLIHAL